MRELLLLLIDLVWLVTALGLLGWGGFMLLKPRDRWKRALGFVTVGALFMAARFMGPVWQVIHEYVGR